MLLIGSPATDVDAWVGSCARLQVATFPQYKQYRALGDYARLAEALGLAVEAYDGDTTMATAAAAPPEAEAVPPPAAAAGDTNRNGTGRSTGSSNGHAGGSKTVAVVASSRQKKQAAAAAQAASDMAKVRACGCCPRVSKTDSTKLKCAAAPELHSQPIYLMRSARSTWRSHASSA